MNDLSKVPAAELVGEYERTRHLYNEAESMANYPRAQLQGTEVMFREEMRNYEEYSTAIAQELDMRCDAAGMEIQFGTHVVFKKASSVVSNYPYPDWKISMVATELHALLGWLLMKGGNP